MNHVPNRDSEENRISVETAFLRNEKLIRSIAFACAPIPDMVEDIVQEVFLEMLTKQERWTLEDPKRTRNLLVVVTRQITQRLWQRRKRDMPSNLARIAERLFQKPDLSETLRDKELSDKLSRAMDRLKSGDQALLRQYYFEKTSTKEIAQRLKMTEDHVRRNLSRAREKLRAQLDIINNLTSEDSN